MSSAVETVDLDQGSCWSDLVGTLLRLRTGDRAGALELARALPPEGADRRFLVACLEDVTGTALDAPAGAPRVCRRGPA
ncbi:MAG TPA: hypothetical protein VF200_09260 [Woeseiaceae bacterium]